MRLLYDEILADEISHVGYVTAQLGTAGRRLMVWLYRHLGVRLAAQMPELVTLFGAPSLARHFEDFPLEVIAAEPEAKPLECGSLLPLCSGDGNGVSARSVN